MNTKDAERTVALKCLIKLWTALEMSLVNRETNLILTWSANCIITTNSTGARAFAIEDTKFHTPVIILSTQDNAKLLQQLISGFK